VVDALIPDDIKDFILETLDSIAQLEALLLLRANRDQEWSADAVAGRLYISVQETVPLLERLCQDGFLVSKDGKAPRYRYRTRSAEVGQIVDRLADVYAKHLVAVTQLIHSKPRSRVKEFADAFRLRKE
jgi:hypothetical protein